MPKLRRSFRQCLAATVALCLVASCSSPDTVAAQKAAEAQADLARGRITDASIAIGKALAARDDVPDYWLLKAHIDLKADNRQSAFSDYQYVIQLDHANMEALQALCQLGPSAGDPDQVDRYADQLLLLAPDSTIALAAKGSVALYRGSPDQAAVLADRILAQDPQNMSGLTLKARVMISRNQYADAAALIEKAPDSPVNTVGKLKFLMNIYANMRDRSAYEQTMRRLAAAAPDDADIQFEYADMLYQDGQNLPARGVIHQIMARYPTNFQVAGAALNVLMEAGPQALDIGTMVADAASLSLLMKADYARFANETGHPDIAIAILRGADQGDPTSENSNAKAALAYAIGLKGHVPEAMAQLNTILDGEHDPNQPWALLARARLLAASHNYTDALRDARLLVANARNDPTAHLELADILQASGNAVLSLSALREGLRANPGSTRLAGRLAATLAAHGDKDQAAQVARNLIRGAPMDQRAALLGKTYGAASPGTLIS